MSQTLRLTAAQAMVKYLASWRVEKQRLFEGMWAIFGHGNVAGIGEALYAERSNLPTFRGHNEQAMAHAAIAFSKANFRRRMMAVTTSIGPGATNLVTAAATAHVNRLPVLLIPGDIFVTRKPDPVLQQVEDFSDGTISANDCFKPVSRYFDRIVAPEQLLTALPRAISVLTDAVNCGPVTLAFPQDVQTVAFDFPAEFFQEKVAQFRAAEPSLDEIQEAAAFLKNAQSPLIVAGGGTLYSHGGTEALNTFCAKHNIPVTETQAGKGALAWNHPYNAGSVGVTGSTASVDLARQADLILAVGTRLQDFTTGSNRLFQDKPFITINVNGYDATKSRGNFIQGDVAKTLIKLSQELGTFQSSAEWKKTAETSIQSWRKNVDKITSRPEKGILPYEAHVIGAVQKSSTNDIVVCAAGSLPAELHKLWKTSFPGGYHVEYGYSCMGYEIAGGVGVKMARPEKEVFVILGDGSYLMMNSEIATAVSMGVKMIVIVLDNRGFGCINRLQVACGGASFNNLLTNSDIRFADHARALGATSEHVENIDELEEAIARARESKKTYVISIHTDPAKTTSVGGTYWEVAIPQVSTRSEVNAARKNYEAQK